MTLIADVFRKLWIPKNVVRQMSKKSRFRGPFDKQNNKWDQTVLKSEWHHFCQIHWSLWRQLSSKKFLLEIDKILGLFFNISTTCHKYSLRNIDNLKQPTQMQSSPKRKTFSRFFFCIFEMSLKFWTLLNKDDTHSWCILEVTDSKNRG